MNANLVRAASFDAHLDQRELPIARRADALEHLDVGDSGTDAFALQRAPCRHAGAADEIAADGKIDSDRVARDRAMDESEIGLLQLAAGEHLAQLAVGAVVLGNHDDAAGLLVEAMDDAGTKIASDVRELVEVVQQSVDQGSVVAFVRSCRCALRSPAWTIMPAGLSMTAR